MSSNKVIFETKTDHTEASTGKDIEGVGQLRLEGNSWYRWVKNTSGAALAAGDLVCYDITGGTAYHHEVDKPVTANFNHLAGVALAAVPSNGWGWILIEGTGSVKVLQTSNSDSTIAIGNWLNPVDSQHYMKNYVAGSIALTAASSAASTSFGVIPPILGLARVQVNASVASASTTGITALATAVVHCLTV